MAERSGDKKIRTLRDILGREEVKKAVHPGKDDEPYPRIDLQTYDLKLTYEILLDALEDFQKQNFLTIARKHRIPEFDEIGDQTDSYTDDYAIDVDVKDKVGLLKLLKEFEDQNPKRQKPLIKEKALELIAKKIGDLDSGGNLIKFLKTCGVDEELIVYPQTKWVMVFDVMTYLASSGLDRDEEMLSKIIGEATHPLMHNGDGVAALALRKQFDEYLRFDDMAIGYNQENKTYRALPNMDDDEVAQEAQEQGDAHWEYLKEQEQKRLEFLNQPENKERISLIRKAYQSLMNVVSAFCENPTDPTVELNNHFQFLNRLTHQTIMELGLSIPDDSPFSRNEHFFHLPFWNLFAAEKSYREKGEELSWQKLRPEMNAMYGDIEALYQDVNGSDILAESDKQEKINEIQLYLSKMKEKSAELKRVDKIEATPVTKIEITSLPELRIKKAEENIVKSGLKSIHLITESVAASKAIFLVLDERFEAPIRCEARNKQGGDTFIKKLHNIAYFADAPGKKVDYDKNRASDINNALFRIAEVSEYMTTNKFDKKPTLVKKSGDNTLVLKNEIVVKTGLIRQDVPSRYQSLYTDKTQ